VIITTHLDVFLTIIMWVCTLIDMVFNTPILYLAVGAPSEQCCGVTCSSNSICVLNGSSVDISCTYKCPRDHRINTTFWFNKQKSSQLPVDLNLGEDYQNHTEYVGKSENSCTLRLKDMRESHSGEYAFRFTTEKGQSYSGLPGVSITVTGRPFNYFDNEMCVHIALCPPTHNISSSSAGADNS